MITSLSRDIIVIYRPVEPEKSLPRMFLEPVACSLWGRHGEGGSDSYPTQNTYPDGDVQLFLVGEKDANGPLLLGQGRHSVQWWRGGGVCGQHRSPSIKLLRHSSFYRGKPLAVFFPSAQLYSGGSSSSMLDLQGTEVKVIIRGWGNIWPGFLDMNIVYSFHQTSW